MNFGKNIPEGFVPDIGSAEELFRRAGILHNGFEGLKNTEAGKHMADQVETPNDQLKRKYVRVFHGTASREDAQDVLEDMMDRTLRRGNFMPQPGMTADQYMPYMLERHGQNGFMVYILKMLQDGIELPAPGSKKSGKNSRKKSK
jgi:hypothetical protein